MRTLRVVGGPDFARNSNNDDESSPWFSYVFGVNGMPAHRGLIRSPGFCSLCSVRGLILYGAEERGISGTCGAFWATTVKASTALIMVWVDRWCRLRSAGRSSTASRCYGGRSRRSGPATLQHTTCQCFNPSSCHISPQPAHAFVPPPTHRPRQSRPRFFSILDPNLFRITRT